MPAVRNEREQQGRLQRGVLWKRSAELCATNPLMPRARSRSGTRTFQRGVKEQQLTLKRWLYIPLPAPLPPPIMGGRLCHGSSSQRIFRSPKQIRIPPASLSLLPTTCCCYCPHCLGVWEALPKMCRGWACPGIVAVVAAAGE